MNRVLGLGPRFAAWRILHDVRHGVPFDVALGRAIRDLEPPDRRLAHELAAGVFRNLTALDAVIRPAVDRDLESVRPDTLDALRIGVFQLIELDRVPAHAAVETTVGVARRLGGEKVAGFVNAVLRRLVREQLAAPERLTPLATDPVEALAAQHSHPPWLVKRWASRFGIDETEQLLAWNNTKPPLVLQPARWSADELQARLDQAGVPWTEAPWESGLVVAASRPTDLPGFADGSFVVQDPAHVLVCRYFDLPERSLVFDACSAPGGKAVMLSRTARLVVAGERQRSRMRRLVENVRRASVGPIEPVVADAAHPPIGKADAVLLDVPCLGTGTFARNPDARWRVTPDALERLAGQARVFLAAAADVVAPDGLLLFATCSLEPEENEQQIERFLTHDPRFRREPSARVSAELLSADGDLVILPHRHGMDGAFACRLRKVAG